MKVLLILFELVIGNFPLDRGRLEMTSTWNEPHAVTIQLPASAVNNGMSQVVESNCVYQEYSQAMPTTLFQKTTQVISCKEIDSQTNWINRSTNPSSLTGISTAQMSPAEFDPDIEEKEREIASLQKTSISQSEDLKRQTWLRNLFIIGLIIAILVAGVITKRYKLKRQSEQHFISQNTELQIANREILQHQESIMLQNQQLQHQATEIQLINESLIEKNNQLEELNAEINSLMHIVAHDLQSPLNRVSGLSQLISIEGDLNENQQYYLELIQKTALEGSRLIKDLLDINAIEQQSNVINWEDLNLSGFFPPLLADYLQTAKRKHITIHYQDDTQGAQLNADQRYLTRIMDNLLSNAIKFSHFERNIFVRLTEDEKNILIAVEDQGQGISETDQTKLFRKFQKLSAQPTGGESSTGLGMWIIKTLVEALNGHIRVESKWGQGTTFTLSFKKNIPQKPVASVTHKRHSRAV